MNGATEMWLPPASREGQKEPSQILQDDLIIRLGEYLTGHAGESARRQRIVGCACHQASCAVELLARDLQLERPFHGTQFANLCARH